MNKKNIIISAVLLLVVAALVIVCFVAGGKKINKTITCYSLDGEVLTVTFDCTKHRRIFTGDIYYKGSLEINGTKYLSMHDVFPRDSRDGNTPGEMFLNAEFANSTERFGHMAFIVMYSDETVWLGVYEEGKIENSEYEGSKDFFGPADTIEDAKHIYDRICEQQSN